MESILSNKGLMPLLWRFFPGHPNLLASWFDGEKPQIAAGESYVRKPIYSREGGNVTILTARITLLTTLMVITPMNR